MLWSLMVSMAGLHWGSYLIPCPGGALIFPTDKGQWKCTLILKKMREKVHQCTQARHVISFTHLRRFFFQYVSYKYDPIIEAKRLFPNYQLLLVFIKLSRCSLTLHCRNAPLSSPSRLAMTVVALLVFF